MRDYFERRRQLRQLQEEAIVQHRLPPGQALTVKWPTLHAGPIPKIDLQRWRFRIFGLVEEPTELDWARFSALPRVTAVSDIHCVTRWTKLDNTWEGVRPAEVLGLAAIKPEAQYVMVHAPGYSANLPLEALLAEDSLFALKHDGQELERVHGGPVRLVVPQRYFWKSVKWVEGLELMAQDRPGYWEQRGYHNEGDPWTEERFGPW